MLEAIILLLAGLGAGIVTGLIGASAVIIAVPLLVVFLDYPAYLAIGIALSIDVFASLFATIVYKRHGRIKIKPSLILLISALVAVLIGSYFSKYIPSEELGLLTSLGVIFTGIMIMLKKKKNFSSAMKFYFFKKYKTLSLILVGLLIGTIAGVFGGGGGIMILLALTFILNYKTHEAVGTSVFLMIFIALFGGIAHYINMPFSTTALILGSCGGIIGAIGSAKFANFLDEKTLSKLVGIMIIVLGLLLTLKNIIFF